MSWISDSTQLISGAWRSSIYAGHGVLGQNVPSTGLHGPAILYAGLNLPAENLDEFRALILTRPGTLPNLVIDEDSSVDSGASPPDGVHSGTWRGYKNGVAYGPDPSTYTIVIGAGLTGGATLDDVGASGSLGVNPATVLSGGATLDSVSAAGTVTSVPPGTLSGGAVLDDVAAAGTLATQPPAILGGAATLDSVAAAGTLAGLPAPSLARTYIIYPDPLLPNPVGGETVVMPTYLKDPDSLLDYTWDWTPYLADLGDTAASLVVELDPSLTLVIESALGNRITVWVQGPLADQVVPMRCRITTGTGRVDDRTIQLQGISR